MTIDTNKPLKSVKYEGVEIELKPESKYPDEYVSDGLILRYDAIENTRHGHDASVNVWEDLSGNDNDLTVKVGDDPIIGDDFYYFNKTIMTSKALPSGQQFVECVFQTRKESSAVCFVGIKSTAVGTTSMRSGKFSIAISGSSGSNGCDLPVVLDKVVNQFAIKGGSAGIDDQWAPSFSISNLSWGSAVNVSVGGYSDLSQYLPHFYLLAYRLYNRALTVDERKQNLEQDKKRFGLENGRVIELEELFNALPDLQGESNTIYVSSEQKKNASAEVIAIATQKGWTVA